MRTTQIAHNHYDADGKVIKTTMETSSTNETADEIFLTYNWTLKQCKQLCDHVGTGSWKNNTGKKAFYENNGIQIAIVGYTCKHGNGKCVFTYEGKDGNKFNVEFIK